MRCDEAFVQAVEQTKMERPTKVEPRCAGARSASARNSFFQGTPRAVKKVGNSRKRVEKRLGR